jgi:DNA-binding NarL/FixJ family response regulator
MSKEKKYENPVERIYYGMNLRQVNLTRRESEIMRWICFGLRNSEISEMMAGTLASRGVESHVRNILIKSGLKSRVQLAIWGLKEGILNFKELPGVEE